MIVDKRLRHIKDDDLIRMAIMNTASNTEPTRGSSKKRKGDDDSARHDKRSEPRSKKPRVERLSRQRDARQLVAQTSFKAFRNGELDVDKFVRSREYEIHALEQGLINSKKALTKRAFQQVPKDLRRRTASHNVKRVPKRLQKRAKREMKDDNTPTVDRSKRKQTSRLRLRTHTAARLRLLSKGKAKTKKTSSALNSNTEMCSKTTSERTRIITRNAKIKESANNAILHRKFRKRQKDKSWLPTHLYHAKRARMTPPSRPLWGFAIPLTPTAKSYRPTHRAASERGAIAWDTSYVSTILLTGVQASILNVLSVLSMSGMSGAISETSRKKWLSGCQVLDVLLHEREGDKSLIGPTTLIWKALSQATISDSSPQTRSLLVRFHPSMFHQLWTEMTRASKIAKPAVLVEDLRYQIGSVEIVGPESTQALSSVLWSYQAKNQAEPWTSEELDGNASTMLQNLRWLTNTSVLPPGVLLSFEAQDPRLHFPPHKQTVRDMDVEQEQILHIAADWPQMSLQDSTRLFDRPSKYQARAALPTQKAIARRRTAAGPGKHLEVLKSVDPQIPVMLYTSAHDHGSKNLSKWTLMLPWKCVSPVWYTLMYTSMASGNQPRLGGLDELRTLALEQGGPWFPADFPATKAGWSWELEQRKLNKEAWERRPKSKRTNWESLDLGQKVKGEVGSGFACDWMQIFDLRSTTQAEDVNELHLSQIETSQARLILNGHLDLPAQQRNGLFTVRIKMVGRGLPEPRARIYRLPEEPTQRNQWTKLCSRTKNATSSTRPLPQTRSIASLQETHQQLAKSLLEPLKQQEELPCPSADDLIGFVTSGCFDLGAGKGLAIANLSLPKLVTHSIATTKDAERFCIIRNVGQTVCRLARWEVV